MPFTTASIPNLTGKTVLITGANSGLGRESARALCAKGAHVILAVRDPEKARFALDELKDEQPLASLEVLPLDLASLASVRRAAQEVLDRYGRLDVLMNNAGIMATPYRQTEDGFELQFGTNHLGHFALTGLLFPLLARTAGARVVNVSSEAHKLGRMRFDDLGWTHGYAPWPAYGMSKLANLLFTYELARRIAHKELAVVALAAHPGYAATNLQQRGAEIAGHKLRAKLIQLVNPLAGQSAAMGALPQLYAATAPEVAPGDYIGPDGPFAARGYPKKMRSNRRSHDEAAMKQLWEASEQLTGVTFPGL